MSNVMGCKQSCCKHSCCKCPCTTQKHRCCGCGVPTVPNENDDLNIKELTTSEEYNKWLERGDVQEGRKWFYYITLYVDIYCWMMVVGFCSGMLYAHLIPILHLINPDIESWQECVVTDSGKLSALCLLTFHVIEGLPFFGVVGICIYILWHWNYDDLPLFEKLLGLSNLLTIIFLMFEGVVVWFAFVRDAPWYQSGVLFVLMLTVLLGVVLGWFVQYNVYVYSRIVSNFTVKYPKTDAEIVSLVYESFIDKGSKIRVIGSKHSAPPTIYVDNLFAQNEIMISLDYFTGIKSLEVLDEEEKDPSGDLIVARATVRAGTCLGLNRDNPLSTESNGLVYMLEAKGYALPDLGGVVMQTVGGFTSMGCAGGSIYHDYYDSIYSIKLVDGTGTVRTFVKPSYEEDQDYKHPYWGVIVSMGLMGIILEVTYNLQRSYKVLGSQLTWPVGPVPDSKQKKYPITWDMEQNQGVDQETGEVVQDGDWTGKLKVFPEHVVEHKENWDEDKEDKDSLYALIMNPENKHKTEYLRIFAWPQVDPQLWTIWKGHRKQPADSDLVEWKGNFGTKGRFSDVLYHEVAKGAAGVVEQGMLGFLYNFFDHFTNLNTMQLPKWAVNVIQKLIIAATPTSDQADGQQYFGASWCDILPMDQEIWTKLMPMQFTELWFDIEDTAEVMQILKEYWADNEGLHHSGTFSWEMYPAKAGGYSGKGQQPGGAWLRPSFGRTSFRVDVLWFDVKTQIPYDFYNDLWNVFAEKEIHFRPHWAKWFPGGNVPLPKGAGMGATKMWRDYYKKQYPRWSDWMNLRKKMDPQNIFVSKFWADTLDIEGVDKEDNSADDGRTDQIIHGDAGVVHSDTEIEVMTGNDAEET